MSDHFSQMERAKSYSYTSSSSNTFSSQTSTAPSTTAATAEVDDDAREEEDDDNDDKEADDNNNDEEDDDEEEEKSVLIPGCHRGRRGTLIRDIRPDSPAPFSDADSDADYDFDLERSTKVSRGQQSASTTTTTRPRTRVSLTKKRAVSDQKAQSHPSGPWGHDCDATRDERSMEEVLARKRLSSSSHECDVTGSPAATPGAFRAVDFERDDAASRRLEEFERKKAELRGFVLTFTKMAVEQRK